jgi:hypothetical protein
VISLLIFFRPWGIGGWLLGIIVLLMLVSLGLRIFAFRRRRHFLNSGAPAWARADPGPPLRGGGDR